MLISKLQQSLNQFPVTFINDLLIYFVSVRGDGSLSILDEGKEA